MTTETQFPACTFSCDIQDVILRGTHSQRQTEGSSQSQKENKHIYHFSNLLIAGFSEKSGKQYKTDTE